MKFPIPGAGRGWGAPLLLAAAAALLHLWPALGQLLEYDRRAILEGEVWRIVTGHAVHFTLDHLIWDVMAFAGLGAFCAMLDRRRFWLATLGSAVLISGALLVLSPSVEVCRGLSGIDSALFVLAAVSLIRSGSSTWIASAALVGFLGKLGFELVTGATLFVDSASAGMTPLPLAHAAGAVVGLASALLPLDGKEEKVPAPALMTGGCRPI